MKNLFLLLFFSLTACSLDKNSVYWNESSKNKDLENKKLSILLKKKIDFKKMTFDEFNLVLKDYSNKADFIDINN